MSWPRLQLGILGIGRGWCTGCMGSMAGAKKRGKDGMEVVKIRVKIMVIIIW
jgi:hypothetical protein